MALKIEWLEEAERDLDVEIDYVYHEFGIKAAQKAYSTATFYEEIKSWS